MFILSLVLFPRAVRQQQSVCWICAGLITAQRWTSALLQALPQLKQQLSSDISRGVRCMYMINISITPSLQLSPDHHLRPSPAFLRLSETVTQCRDPFVKPLISTGALHSPEVSETTPNHMGGGGGIKCIYKLKQCMNCYN